MNLPNCYSHRRTTGLKRCLTARIIWPLLTLLVVVGSACGDQDAGVADKEPTRQSEVPAAVQARVLRVIDGDTIEVDRALDGRATVRYIGIDTPETVAPNQPVGCLSREAIENLIRVGAFAFTGLHERELLWQFGNFYRSLSAQ